MSNYITQAIRVNGNGLEYVTMLDNYFGLHEYGVMFPDGAVYKESECQIIESMQQQTNLCKPRHSKTKLCKEIFYKISETDIRVMRTMIDFALKNPSNISKKFLKNIINDLDYILKNNKIK